MSYFNFFLCVNDNLTTYLVILLSTLTFYYLIFRRTIVSVLDPLFFALVSSSLGSTVVLFLYRVGKIESVYYYDYLLTQSALYLGFFLFLRTKPRDLRLIAKTQERSVTHDGLMSLLFYSTTMVTIIAQLIIFMTVGIPLFLASRLEIYVVGGGFGVINRIMQISNPVSLYCAFYFLLTRISGRKREKLLSRIYLLILIIFGVLSGARSFFLPMIYGFYYFLFLNRDACKNSAVLFYANHSKELIMTAVILMALVIGIKEHFSILGIAETAVERVASYGDVYFLAYPNRVIENVHGVGILNFLFGDLLRTLRLVPAQFVQQPIGFEIYNLANNTIDVLNGPNPRHNIIGYINWGFTGSIIFSFCCGILLSLGRNLFYTSTNRSHKAKILIMLFYSYVVSIETDPPFCISSINSILLLGVALLIFEYILEYRNKTTHISTTRPAVE